ncbi:hypothetical protein, partial [Rossellomorea marisflavi]|uniref:hypothetical protein n=1 Tax=Rossellomorea marisflavi TaxID=189381 RepID=UPI00345AB2C5
ISAFKPQSGLKRRVLDSSGKGGVARPRRHEEACRPPRRKASACSGKERSYAFCTRLKNKHLCC